MFYRCLSLFFHELFHLKLSLPETLFVFSEYCTLYASNYSLLLCLVNFVALFYVRLVHAS